MEISMDSFREYCQLTHGRPPEEDSERLMQVVINLIDSGEYTVDQAIEGLQHLAANWSKYKRLDKLGPLEPPPALELIDPDIKPLADR